MVHDERPAYVFTSLLQHFYSLAVCLVTIGNQVEQLKCREKRQKLDHDNTNCTIVNECCESVN